MNSVFNEPEIQNWSIFNALHDAIREKSLKKLRFAKCIGCGRLTPYRLKFVDDAIISCKKCGEAIKVGDD